MDIVHVVKKRALCYKCHVACVLFNPVTKEIVAIAYNGTPHGMRECTESDPIMDGPHHINDLHAEDNLFMGAGRKAEGCILYCNLSPCRRCVLKCVQARIKEFVYEEGYNIAGDEDYARDIFTSMGIGFRKYSRQES
jgi:deoxycytidylate deaminase